MQEITKLPNKTCVKIKKEITSWFSNIFAPIVCFKLKTTVVNGGHKRVKEMEKK